MIAEGIILPYDGKNSEIPDGFTRFTTLDGRFAKGASSNIGTTGGASAHTHSSPAHRHALSAHTHTGTLGTVSGADAKTWEYKSHTFPPYQHTHSYTSGGVSTTSYSSSDSLTYGSCSNNPPYYTVIYINSTKKTNLPTNALVMRQTARTGLTYHSASQNRYLRGAASGADAGTTGGSTTNVHSITHTHSSGAAHTHSSVSSNDVDKPSSGGGSEWKSGGEIYRSHTHPLTFGSGTQGIAQYTGSLTTTETVEPLYKSIRHYKADSDIDVSEGDIALTTLSTVPTGWLLCDGNNGTPNLVGYYVKNVNSSSIGSGGFNTHTHAAQSHFHSGSGTHSHSVTCAAADGAQYEYSTTGDYSYSVPNYKHYHDTSCSSPSTGFEAATTTANSASNEPLYYQVKYIMATSSASIVEMTVNAGLGGSVSPESGYANKNIAKTYTITPDRGKVIKSISVNGAAQTVTDKKGMTLTITPTSDTTIDVQFKSGTNYGESLMWIM